VQRVLSMEAHVAVDKRLFLDCDDTLIRYQDTSNDTHHYGVLLHGTPWSPNEDLLARVREFAATYPTALVVIWSGGGAEYAEQCARMLQLDDIGASYFIKDRSTMFLVREGDIVIDDQPLRCDGEQFKPDEWPDPVDF
jgi:hypothetical protein